ncbi:MAG TPA: hypothetical protein PKN33_19260 [Phycisphaerae bacterium]|nr:hypothetical protein [Phycisphaerae bacterium]
MVRVQRHIAKPLGTSVKTLTCLLVVFEAAGLVHADSLVVRGKPLSDIQIVGYSEGMIEYSTAVGDFDRFSILEVQSINVDSIDRATKFNAAEQSVGEGDPRKSVESYETALLGARGFWSDLMRARLVQAADESYSFETAVRNWIKIAHRDAVTASWLLPKNLPTQPSHATRRVLKKLERAIEQSATLTERTLLETLRFSTLKAMDDPAARVLAAPLMGLIIKSSVFAPRTIDVFTTAGDLLVENADYAHVQQQVEKAIVEVPESLLPEILLLKARVQLASATTPEEYLAAAFPAMRVVIHFPKHPLVGEALILSAKAHEASGRSPQARRLLEACIATDQANSEIKSEAAHLLKRLPQSPKQIENESS